LYIRHNCLNFGLRHALSASVVEVVLLVVLIGIFGSLPFDSRLNDIEVFFSI
jgi:hypothetical protein